MDKKHDSKHFLVCFFSNFNCYRSRTWHREISHH